MREGEIIAFRATGETRQIEGGEFYIDECDQPQQWPGGTSRAKHPILIPLTPTEIAQAERMLAAVERNRPLLELFASNGIGVKEAVFAVKEILG